MTEFPIQRARRNLYQELQLDFFKALAEENGIYFTIHLDENLNIADFNYAVSEAYMDTVRRTIMVAKELRVPILNMHMNHGVHFTLPDKKVQLFEKYFAEYESKFRKFIKMCEKEIADSDIRICIENTNGFRDYEKKVIELMLESKVFALTFDIGHSNAVDDIDEKFILNHGNRLAHFHIHDGKGKQDHLTLGAGEIDLAQRINLAEKYGCRCVVETKTIEALEKSVGWLQEKGFRQGKLELKSGILEANKAELDIELQDNEWELTYIDHDRQIARAVVFDDSGNFYFVRAIRDDDFGKAVLIETAGGGVEHGEDLEEAVRRELKEELGIEVHIVCKIGVVSDYYNLIHRHNVNNYYLCKVSSFGEKDLTKDEIENFHLSTLKMTFEEAVREYQKCSNTKLGRLVANRELPVLQRAKEIIEMNFCKY